MRIHPASVHPSTLQSVYKAGSSGARPPSPAPQALPDAVSVKLSTDLQRLVSQAVELHQTMLTKSPTADAEAMVQAGAGLDDEQLDALTVALLQDLI